MIIIIILHVKEHYVSKMYKEVALGLFLLNGRLNKKREDKYTIYSGYVSLCLNSIAVYKL